ncbi:MAG: ribonuclease E/G, partial [Gammaproteobacteria bacterium]|nr:ribonuclease E/G [Gammaproteobacteria bacterium]
QAVEEAASDRPAPFLIFQESNVIIRAIRDYFRQEISEILIDNENVYEQARDFMSRVMPNNLNKVKFYQSDVPLFTRFQIESQIESAFSHSVRLPSGGALVIDHTEALVSIDINSARATKGSDIEETALSTNLEAADEIARQLRIRDVGGLIVIDFIDMTPAKNQREVENRLREALKHDRARIQIGRISRFGLLEMSRQRLRPSLGESSLRTCPTCNGRGNVRGPESLALSVLRIIEEEAMKENTTKVVARLPVEIATFLLNEKREAIRVIERRQGIAIIVVPDPLIQASNYEVQRIRDADADHEANRQPSYELARDATELPEYVHEPVRRAAEEPAVKSLGPSAPPAPTVSAPPPPPAAAPAGRPGGLIARVMGVIFGPTRESPELEPEPRQAPRDEQKSRPPRGRGRTGGGERKRRGGRRSGGKRGDGRSAQSDRGQPQERGQQQRSGGGRGGRRRSNKRASRGERPRSDAEASADENRSSGPTQDGGRGREASKPGGDEPRPAEAPTTSSRTPEREVDRDAETVIRTLEDRPDDSATTTPPETRPVGAPEARDPSPAPSPRPERDSAAPPRPEPAPQRHDESLTGERTGESRRAPERETDTVKED